MLVHVHVHVLCTRTSTLLNEPPLRATVTHGLGHGVPASVTVMPVTYATYGYESHASDTRRDALRTRHLICDRVALSSPLLSSRDSRAASFRCVALHVVSFSARCAGRRAQCTSEACRQMAETETEKATDAEAPEEAHGHGITIRHMWH